MWPGTEARTSAHSYARMVEGATDRHPRHSMMMTSSHAGTTGMTGRVRSIVCVKVVPEMSAAPCALCGHANPAGSNYCNECGASLQLALCRECEAINHRTAATCHKCGAELPGKSSIAGMAGALPSDESVAIPPSATLALQTSSPAVDAPATRRVKATSTANPAYLALLAAVALAAAAYYAYLDDTVTPPASSTMTDASGDSEASRLASAPDVVRDEEPGAGSETGSANAADVSAALPGGTSSADDPGPSARTIAAPESGTVADETSPETQSQETASPQAADAPATITREERPRRLDERDARRDRSVPASPPGAGMAREPPTSPAPAPGTTFEPPAACTDGMVALGLCKRNGLDEGK